MAENKKDQKDISIDKKELNLLVANIIPTSRYFEICFDYLQKQIDELKEGQKEIRADMSRRFEQVDKRFEQVDKRFDQVNAKFDTIIERMDTKIDTGLRENRAISIRLFTFATVFSAISM